MDNLLKQPRAEEFLWVYINDYAAGKFGWNDKEAEILIASLFYDVDTHHTHTIED